MSDTHSIRLKTVVPNAPPADDGTHNTTLLETENLSLYYGRAQALKKFP